MSMRFDIIIDYSFENREKIYNIILKEIKNEYSEYNINIKVDIDV